MKLKVGDTVKVINPFAYGYSRSGTIIKIRKKYTLRYTVKIEEWQGRYSEAELKKTGEKDG